jgi:DNA-binding response OmpR family regulator
MEGVRHLARLLLVEDEPAQLDFYRQLLTHEGHEVMEAQCGREAIRVAKSFRPTLVVLDLVLPDMDGTEAIAAILSECADRPKIIINTCYERYRVDFRCWGADAFVLKSSDPEALRSTVRQVLSTEPGDSGGRLDACN